MALLGMSCALVGYLLFTGGPHSRQGDGPGAYVILF